MSTLYELTEEYQELLALADDPEIDEQAFLDTLEGLEGELEIKAEGYVKVIDQLTADAEAYKSRAEAWSKKGKLCEKRVKALKDALMNAMIITGHDDKKGLRAGLVTLKVQGNGGQKPLKITGEVPEEFIKLVPEVDGAAIRKHLEELPDGVECSWAKLEERGRHLSIK